MVVIKSDSNIQGKNFAILSLFLSSGVIISLLIINKEILLTYQQSSRKTQLWFALIEATQFTYKYFFIIPGLLSFWFAFISFRAGEIKWLAIMAIVLSLASLGSVFIRFWKLWL